MINFLVFIAGVVVGGMFGAFLYIVSVLNREACGIPDMIIREEEEKWVEEDLKLRKYLKDNE